VTGPALGMRPVTNVADLPTTTFGHRSIAWWGTIGFIVIEGTTLFISAMSYLYLRVTVGQWAPAYAPLPSLGVAAVQVALMVGSNIPMVMVDRAARRLDLPAVRAGMVVISLLAVVMCVLRGFEFAALNVRWDDNAYGTAAWAILVAHATLLLVETIETLVQTALMFSPNLEQRDISAIADNALYWYFMTGVWVPLAAIAFLTPYLAGRLPTRAPTFLKRAGSGHSGPGCCSRPPPGSPAWRWGTCWCGPTAPRGMRSASTRCTAGSWWSPSPDCWWPGAPGALSGISCPPWAWR